MEVDNKVKYTAFLKDVLVCSLGAYGGPEAHYGVFTNQMVDKKKYLTEAELAELIALTALLPGPSSSQTIVSIGYKQGGPLLAFLTMLVWAMPVLIVMTILSFSDLILTAINLSIEGLRYIGPMAMGFIVVALVRLGSKVLVNKAGTVLFVLAAITSYFFRFVWVFPLLLILGGLMTVFLSKESQLWHKVKVKPQWTYITVFAILALGSFLAAQFYGGMILTLFEQFYRYGYLVIGGGQVLVPYMYNGLVEVAGYITHENFVTGYGLVQGLPGPMFSFSAYAGGIAAQNQGVFIQVLSAMVSGIAIFLPGLLLIYFIYPMWEQLKMIKGLKVALSGVIAVACGLIFSTAIILIQSTDWSLVGLIVTVLTVVSLLSKKLPAPIIVALVLMIGFIL